MARIARKPRLPVRCGGDRSTICRELRRKFWHDPEVPIAEGYWHLTAHDMAADRRRKYRKLLRHPDFAQRSDRLKSGWSSEQISGRLRLAGGSSARLSHETIYQDVCSREGPGLAIAQYLPERRRSGGRDALVSPEISSFQSNAPFATDPMPLNPGANSAIGKRI